MRNANVNRWMRLSGAVMICLVCAMSFQAKAGSIEIAEELLVDLRAEDLSSGAVSEWPNRGSLGGVFTATGSPVVQDVGGWESVSLDGDSYFEGPRTVPGIEGDGTRTIEIWAYKIGLAGEQTMVSWAHRGGPDGTNMAFNYAENAAWGAVGHWGAGPDMGWGGDHAPTPALDTWWYLVYTHDGATSRLYVNGDPAGEEGMTLNTHANGIIRVGAQADGTGEAADVAMNFIGGVAQIRIHDGVLTPEQIQRNAEIRIQSSETASNPNPTNNASDVLRDSDLSWKPGEFAASHTLYMGESFDDVTVATEAAASDLDVNSFDPGRLTFGKTVFWRVDEVNGTPDKTVFTGNVWSFTVEPFSIQIPGSEIIATASSASNDLSTPDKTLDGSGLGEAGTHSIQTEDMWFTAMGDMNPWIQYEFDGIKKLDIMKVWNSNSSAEGFIGYGVNAVLIEYSKDGQTWETLEGVNEFSRAPGSPIYAEYDEIDFGGVAAKMIRLNIQSNFGGFMQAYSLSEVQFSMIPAAARTPVPVFGAVDIFPTDVLSWRAGREAAQSTIYLSTDPNEVADGLAPSVTSSTNSVNLGAFDIEMGKTYYWRVDEVNEAEVESVWAGPVWSFSIVAAWLVDDFENYSNVSPNRPFQTWLDGIGYSADEFFSVGYNGNGTDAAIGHDIWDGGSSHYNGNIMEQTLTAVGSGQSMPFYYSGNSQTDRTFETAQDWSIAGITTLVMYFNGDRANDAGLLYVTINGNRVDYPKASALSSGIWTQWNIDLESLGVNLSQVNTMSIGIESIGSGVVYVDQISLYSDAPEAPVSSDPGTTGLAAEYSFENDYTDSSGHGLTGTPTGIPTFDNGLAGNGMAMSLNGVDDFVEVPVGDIIASSTSMSIACWANFSNEGGAWQRLWDFGSGDNVNPYMFLCPRSGTTGPTRFAIRSATVGEQIIDGPSTLASGWQHVTVVIDGDAGLITMYINGAAVVQGATVVVPSDLGVTTQNYLGKSQWPDALYQGSLDEVLIYTRALSEGEIRYLAGDR